MSSAALKRLSWDEYVQFERHADEKHEYYDGEVFAMVGGSAWHSLIGGNVIRVVGNALEPKDCQVYTSDMRVLCPSGLGTYPDCSIVCGPPEYLDDAKQDTLLNPIVIFEVLSPTTEAYDRGKKFAHYETLSSLKEYVLLSQDQVRIEHFARRPQAGQWLRTVVNDANGTLELPALGISLSLAQLYAKVTFEAPANRDSDSQA
jgi:Uma2 family endonuclease